MSPLLIDALPVEAGEAKARTIGGSRLNVEKYRCRCGKGREVRRPLGAAAA